MAEIYKNFINGKWVEAKSGKTFENRNPADRRDLIGLFPASGPEDVEGAVRGAGHALGEWGLGPGPPWGPTGASGLLLSPDRRQLGGKLQRCAGRASSGCLSRWAEKMARLSWKMLI